MNMSELIHILHWIIYILSFCAFGLLFTKYYKWGAVYIGILFLIQIIFNGCPVVDLQNYFRIQEGLLPIHNSMLVDRFSSNHIVQIVISGVISLVSFVMASYENIISN